MYLSRIELKQHKISGVNYGQEKRDQIFPLDILNFSTHGNGLLISLTRSIYHAFNVLLSIHLHHHIVLTLINATNIAFFPPFPII